MIPQGSARPHEEDPDVTGIQYFLPRQVILQLEHPAKLQEPGVAQVIQSFFDYASNDYNWIRKLAPPKAESVMTFPYKDQERTTISLVKVQMRSPEEMVALGPADHQENPEEDYQGNYPVKHRELIPLLLEIYRDLGQAISIAPDGAVRLTRVSPNWLMGGAWHGGATGGPGGFPDEAIAPRGGWADFLLPDTQEIKALQGSGGKDVHVAILDTMPCLSDLFDAYKRWGSKYRLHGSLLEPGRSLHLYPATYADLNLVKDYSLIGHPYRMPDHGLFVAGIIHTLAPEATLHLFQVLDAYGAGCLQTVAQGLFNVLRNPEIGRPLVLNCSLVLSASFDQNYNLAEEFNPEFPVELRDPNTLKHMTLPIREMFERLEKEGVAAVGAAGNDAKDGRGRPPSRYPAALEKVFGVAALPKGRQQGGNYQAASYSNLSDAPPDKGYATLGGEQGSEQGIRSIYIGEFPKYPRVSAIGDFAERIDPHDYKRNDTGWAWWSGTSFAAPVISGILAKWFALNLRKSPADARDFLDRAATDNTVQSEKVILVEQP